MLHPTSKGQSLSSRKTNESNPGGRKVRTNLGEDTRNREDGRKKLPSQKSYTLFLRTLNQTSARFIIEAIIKALISKSSRCSILCFKDLLCSHYNTFNPYWEPIIVFTWFLIETWGFLVLRLGCTRLPIYYVSARLEFAWLPYLRSTNCKSQLWMFQLKYSNTWPLFNMVFNLE